MRDATRHPLPSGLLSEVDAFVAAVRSRHPRRLDPDLLASKLGIEVTRRDLGETLLGLTIDERHMLIHSGLRGARLNFVFAHEVAHVLHRRGGFRDVASSDEEWFADWFARELVLPRGWLRDRWPRTQLGALYVDSDTAALQLAAVGTAPALMRNGTRVLCRQCGTRMHDWHCECRLWRAPDRDVSALADVHQLDLLYTPTRWRAAWLPLATCDVLAPAAAS